MDIKNDLQKKNNILCVKKKFTWINTSKYKMLTLIILLQNSLNTFYNLYYDYKHLITRGCQALRNGTLPFWSLLLEVNKNHLQFVELYLVRTVKIRTL